MIGYEESEQLELWNAEASFDDEQFWDLIRTQVPKWPLSWQLELTDEDKLAKEKAEQQVSEEFEAPSDEGWVESRSC